MEPYTEANQDRKETECDTCGKTFWYIDPRPGGRPRKKCGLCSSRPPRYPWGFLSASDTSLAGVSDTGSTSENNEYMQPMKSSMTDSVLTDARLMPSPAYPVALAGGDSHGSKPPRAHTTSTRSESSMDHSRIEQQLDDISRRLAELEMKVDSMRSQFIGRSDWIDMSARLDMVEHSMSETLGKVRGRLDSFSKEVRQIAVVPERELGEMFELIRMIRRYLDNS